MCYTGIKLSLRYRREILSLCNGEAARGRGYGGRALWRISIRRSFVLKDEEMRILEGKVYQVELHSLYRGADKSLVRPGRKQVTATEDFDVHISYL